MKLLHSAGLALVGWYLIVPSFNPAALLISEPVSEWNHWASYYSAKSCESALNELKDEAFAQAQYDCLTDRSRSDLCHGDVAKENSECISTEDPRLKEF